MRRRPLERHASEGLNKPLGNLRRRRRHRCLFVGGLVLFVVFLFFLAALVLAHYFEAFQGGGGGGLTPDPETVDGPHGEGSRQRPEEGRGGKVRPEETPTVEAATPTAAVVEPSLGHEHSAHAPSEPSPTRPPATWSSAASHGRSADDHGNPKKGEEEEEAESTVQSRTPRPTAAPSRRDGGSVTTKTVIRLFPFLRVLSTAGGGDDDGAAPAIPGGDRQLPGSVLAPARAFALGLPFDATDTVAPLHKVQVELYRQRKDRHTWWRPNQQQQDTETAGGDGAEEEEEEPGKFSSPIVSLRGPSLPVTHYFPHELLVEDVLSGFDGLNYYPDPSRLMVMKVERERAEKKEKEEEEEEDAVVRLRVADDDAGGDERGLGTASAPVLRLSKRRGSPSEAVSPYVSLDWFPSSSSSADAKAIEADLYVLQPKAVDGGGGRDADADADVDPTRTTSLAGVFTFRGLRRLYGLPGAAAAVADAAAEGAPPRSASLSSRFEIPKDGFRHTASVRGRDMNDYSSTPGVIPLLFAETTDGRGGADEGGGALLRQPNGTVVGVLWLSSAPFSVATRSSAAASKAQGESVVTLTLSSSAAETRVFLLPGPTHEDVVRQYYTLTGFPSMPPVFALGYHHHLQTSFNLKVLLPFPSPPPTEAEASGSAGNYSHSPPPPTQPADEPLTVQSALQELNSLLVAAGIPVDSLGFTGDQVHQHRIPFSWQARMMPDPVRLQTNLWLYGRRFFFTRASPHIPVVQSSPLYQEGKRHGFFIGNEPDEDALWLTYPREAAPALLAEQMKLWGEREEEDEAGTAAAQRRGSWASARTHVIDVFNPSARRWLGGMLKLKRFTSSTNKTFVSLAATAPDTLFTEGFTPPMSTGHYQGTSHRQVHNAYSVYYLMGVFNGLMNRAKHFRRAFAPLENYFVGVQRFGGAVFVVPAQTERERAWARRRREGADAASGIGNDVGEGVARGVVRDADDYDGGRLHPEWRRLRNAITDVLSLSMSGVPFAGANAAGFEVDFAHVGDTVGVEAGSGQHASGGAEGRSGRAMTSARRREELVVRWYQAASVFGLMRAEEGRGLPFSLPVLRTEPPVRSASTAAEAVASALSSSVLPSLLSSSNPAIREAIQLRYALLPYLYTSFWRTSETGAPLLSSPTFLFDTDGCESGEEDCANACLAVGSALVACPIAKPAHGSGAVWTTVSLPKSRRGEGKGTLVDFYSGRRYTAGEEATVPMAWREAASARQRRGLESPLVWLGEDGKVKEHSTTTSDFEGGRGRGATVSRLPLFQRQGSIVPTFITFSSSSRSWSSRVPSNISLTIALPPGLQELHRRSAEQYPRDEAGARVPLASGELFWDEGSENTQVSVPPSRLPSEEDDEADAEGVEPLEGGDQRDRSSLSGERPPSEESESEEAAARQAEEAQQRRLADAAARKLSQRQRRAQQRLVTTARYCHVKLSCFLSRGKLFLTGRLDNGETTSSVSSPAGSTSEDRCLEALERLEASWNEVPKQTLEDHLQQRRSAELQRRERLKQLGMEADRGQRRLTDRDLEGLDSTDADRKEGERLSPQDLLPPDAYVAHTLATALQLRYVRFLTASSSDAMWLSETLSRSPALSVVRDDNDNRGGSEEGEEDAGGDGMGSASTTVVTARVIPRVQPFGHRLPTTAVGDSEDVEDTTNRRGGRVGPWRLSFSPPVN